MEIICLDSAAFFSIIDNVVNYVKSITHKEDKWLSTDQSMQRLHIKSKSTLQKLRDEGSIRYSHPEKKWILYDADSIDEYLNKHAKDALKGNI
jgi:hypothetical protein